MIFLAKLESKLSEIFIKLIDNYLLKVRDEVSERLGDDTGAVSAAVLLKYNKWP